MLKICVFLLVCNLIFIFGQDSWYGDYDDYTLSSQFKDPDPELDTSVVTMKSTSDEASQTTTAGSYARECASKESSFSENDLSDLINYFTHTLHIIDVINASYHDHAVSVSNKLNRSIEEFQMKFDSKPKHMKNILGDMEQKLDNANPLALEIGSKLQNIPELDKAYNNKLTIARNCYESLEKSKKICDLNCNKEFLALKKRSLREDYYCSTMAVVKDKITNALKAFLLSYKDVLKNKIDDLNQIYNNSILDINSLLKEKAVEVFGTTMYDVLSLQDENYDYINKLDELDIDSGLTTIKNNLLQIDLKTDILQQTLVKYKKHCLNCSSRQMIRVRRDNDPKIKTDVLDHLINIKISEISNSTEENLRVLFNDIDSFVNNKDAVIEGAVAKLKPIQENIEESLIVLEEKFESLKNLIPHYSLDRVSTLIDDTNDMLQDLDDAIKFISGELNK